MTTGVIPRDILRTISSVSSLSSANSSSDSTDEKHVTAITTAISRNVSSGHAVQINGSVAGKIYHINFKNLVIRYPCGSTPMIASHEAPQLKGSAPNDSNLRKQTPIESVVEIPDNDSTSPTPPAQNLCLYSELSKKREPIRAIFRPAIHENFIERRIVDRLELTSHSDPLVVKTVVWGGKRLSSTSKFVNLACAAEMNGTKNCVAYRFYVVRDCPFDLLFGSNSITPL